MPSTNMISRVFAVSMAVAVLQLNRLVQAESPIYSYTGFEALGCYNDNKSSRLMSYMTGFSGMYAQKCFEICQGESTDYTHFGMQYSFECWCGVDTDVTRHGAQLADSACDMECAGSGQMCGGYEKMNAFEIKEISGENPRVGCFKDSIPRALNSTPKYASPDMTKSMCQEHCLEAGSLFYGVEYGTECWCGNEYDTYGEVVYARNGDYIESFCEEEPCGGDDTDQCGGTWLVAVYRTDLALP